MAITGLQNIDLSTPTQVTRELYTNVGSGVNIVGDFTRAFYDSTDFEIWDSAVGGTQLVEGVDYNLVNKSLEYSARAGQDVYTGYQIINVTYQTGNIYITYKNIGTYSEKELFEDLQAQISALSGGLPGVIQMYGAAAAPTGWLLCNGSEVSQTTYAALYAVIGSTFNTGGEAGGNFRLPDFGGIFPRGAGTNHTLSDAGSTAFSGTLGTYQNDKMQQITGGLDTIDGSSDGYARAGSSLTGAFSVGSNAKAKSLGSAAIAGRNMEFDSSNSPNARTGVETNPANLGINFIIKT